MTADLRLGRWQDVMRDVECDTMICDPPYSERTELGVRSGSTMQDQRNQIGMGYEPITEGWVSAFVEHWSPRTKGWVVVYGDHISARWFESALEKHRYTFAPLPLIKIGAAPRMCADGPGSQAEWIVVARPRSAAFVGTWPGLPGWYKMDTVRHGLGSEGIRGAKSLNHMRQVVRHYSRPGDLIADACSGSGTTLLAALSEGRRAVGAEMDPEHYEIAKKRLAAGYTPPLFTGEDI